MSISQSGSEWKLYPADKRAEVEETERNTQNPKPDTIRSKRNSHNVLMKCLSEVEETERNTQSPEPKP